MILFHKGACEFCVKRKEIACNVKLPPISQINNTNNSTKNNIITNIIILPAIDINRFKILANSSITNISFHKVVCKICVNKNKRT